LLPHRAQASALPDRASSASQPSATAPMSKKRVRALEHGSVHAALMPLGYNQLHEIN
jgi:hypothetical protein